MPNNFLDRVCYLMFGVFLQDRNILKISKGLRDDFDGSSLKSYLRKLKSVSVFFSPSHSNHYFKSYS